MSERSKLMVDQFYLFTVPGDELVWCEMFTRTEGHVVAPTPHSDMQDALAALRAREPAATVDTLCLASEIEEARTWARTCPLEPLPMPA